MTLKSETLKAEFTAIVESAEEGGYSAFCPEVPRANGQGDTIEKRSANSAAAIKLILEDRLVDGLRGLPESAIRDAVAVA